MNIAVEFGNQRLVTDVGDVTAANIGIALAKSASTIAGLLAAASPASQPSPTTTQLLVMALTWHIGGVTGYNDVVGVDGGASG